MARETAVELRDAIKTYEEDEPSLLRTPLYLAGLAKFMFDVFRHDQQRVHLPVQALPSDAEVSNGK